jgi:D-alanine-D-alanine ligase
MKKVQTLAIAAFRSIARGPCASRFPHGSKSRKIYVNGSIPCLVLRRSAYPKLWDATGVSYRELIDRLIQLGLGSIKIEKKSVQPVNLISSS